MEEKRNRINCGQAREVDMVDYLNACGLQPARIRGNNFWYFSPFREERTPSFKINRQLNRWYDFGEGTGGNLIDFAIRYNQCTVSEFLETLGMVGRNRISTEPLKIENQAGEHGIRIENVRTLYAYPLLAYLKERRIPAELADLYCKEVRYRIGEKAFYAIGFKNDSGGFELRNPLFKGSCSPKDITTIGRGSKQIAVFEGFFDFLSFLALTDANNTPGPDYLVLNSLAFFERARPVMEEHKEILLYLNNDQAGRNQTLYAISLSHRYKDQSHSYWRYKDLNDYLNQRPIVAPG